MSKNNPSPRQKLKRELYLLLKKPRTSESSFRIKKICEELDWTPHQTTHHPPRKLK